MVNRSIAQLSSVQLRHAVKTAKSSMISSAQLGTAQTYNQDGEKFNDQSSSARYSSDIQSRRFLHTQMAVNTARRRFSHTNGRQHCSARCLIAGQTESKLLPWTDASMLTQDRHAGQSQGQPSHILHQICVQC